MSNQTRGISSVLIIATVIILGIASGIGLTTFVYARGFSYLSNNPEVCANCHVMNYVYEGWLKGGHQHAATCNDCHVPHTFIRKWWTKMENGFHHSWRFTLGNIPVNIVARPSSRAVVEENCRYCHGSIAAAAVSGLGRQHGQGLNCLSCHRTVGHKG